MFVVAVRHFETGKNVAGVHGYCEDSVITGVGHEQARNLSSRFRSWHRIEAITYFDTRQARASAELLSDLTGIHLESSLSLAPYGLGIADGLNDEQLGERDCAAAESLVLFRERVTPAGQLDIPGSESVHSVEERVLEWWAAEGSRRCDDRIIVGSNSTLLMLTHLLGNSLPSTGRYMCFKIPNGAFRVWNSDAGNYAAAATEERSWPEISTKRIRTNKGFVQYSHFHRGWENRRKLCVICPGYFGNSRHGPYSLYVKLAREISALGYDCMTIDYLGSGESSPVRRSFQTDVYSTRELLRQYESEYDGAFLIGHSLGCAVVARLCAELDTALGIALAPIVTIDTLGKDFFTAEEMTELYETDRVSRRGVTFTADYAREATAAWREAARGLQSVVVAGKDQYDQDRYALRSLGSVMRWCVDNADHNFSHGDASGVLVEKVLRSINMIDVRDCAFPIPAQRSRNLSERLTI